MKEKIKKIGSLALALLCLGLCACGGDEGTDGGDEVGGIIVKPQTPAAQQITNETYQSYWMKQHDYKTMPLVAFNGMGLESWGYSDMVNEAHYKEMADCYINTSYALYDKVNYSAQVIKALEYAEKYNISYVAGGNGFDSATSLTTLESTIYKTLIKNKPKALGGVLILDEPGYTNYEAMSTSRGLFEELLGEDLLYHSNLFPTYASAAQLYNRGNTNVSVPEAGYTYEQYVDDFIRIYQPQVLSYDYYPLKKSGMKNDYFGNMSIIREKAAGAKIPFWVYIQTCSYNKNTRIPNEAELHWLVNTSLAYGSKGIQYFTYVVPVSSGGETFNGSMIDMEGNPTDVYYYAQSMNKYITEIDEVLMCSLSKGLMKSGTTPCDDIPEGDLVSSYGALASVEGNSVLVGCFDYNGKNAYYVVNNDVTAECTATLSFNKASSGYVHGYEGKTDVSGKTSLSLTLGAGKATLVVLD